MTDKKKFQQDVEEAMSYISRMDDIYLDDYFDVRTLARLAQLKREGQRAQLPLWLKILQPSLAAMLVLVNVVSILFIMGVFPPLLKPPERVPFSGKDYVLVMKKVYPVQQNTLDVALIEAMKSRGRGKGK